MPIVKENLTTLDPPLNSFLTSVIKDNKKHALWLNTLSLLEHIGSRKILLTQSNEFTSEMILRHATEEARHALFFKKAARLIRADFNSGYQPNELLNGSSAKMYFAKLDATVRKNLKRDAISKDIFAYLAYLYTTTVIELRAMTVYGAYDELLQSNSQLLSLQNLILEEQGHLEEMSDELKRLDSRFQSRLNELVEKEEKLFQKFLSQLTLSVG